VAEANICPPMAAIVNAIERAVGTRLTELPMSPPKVRAEVKEGSRTGATRVDCGDLDGQVPLRSCATPARDPVRTGPTHRPMSPFGGNAVSMFCA
jgi:hypothetical protein